jgi:lipopolysaccharide transport system permease protein
MSSLPSIVIQAGRSERHYWRELWRYRELFYFLAWRDVLVRYKQTTIGFAWALLRPLLTLAAFTLVFGVVAKLPSGGVPYPLLVFAGLLPWQFFSNAFSEASNSLIENEKMITKVYFPRLIIPTSAVMASFVDLLASGAILICLMVFYGIVPDLRILTLPLFAGLAFCAALGGGLWFAALNVRYRDFRYVVPFFVQVGLYISPVGFLSTLVPDSWRIWFYLNPMAGVIDGIRWALLGDRVALYGPGIAISVAVSVLVLSAGTYYFRRSEKAFADVI